MRLILCKRNYSPCRANHSPILFAINTSSFQFEWHRKVSCLTPSHTYTHTPPMLIIFVSSGCKQKENNNKKKKIRIQYSVSDENYIIRTHVICSSSRYSGLVAFVNGWVRTGNLKVDLFRKLFTKNSICWNIYTIRNDAPKRWEAKWVNKWVTGHHRWTLYNNNNNN